MKPTKSHKPIRKCHDCKLNLGSTCAVYPEPKKMWHHRDCPGHNNEEMYAEYLAELEKQQSDPKRQKRKKAAKERDSEDHHHGTLPLANR